MSGGVCAQLALVLRKNLIFKKRNRKDVLLEILFPCLFFLLLGVLKSNVGAANQLRVAAPSHMVGLLFVCTRRRCHSSLDASFHIDRSDAAFLSGRLNAGVSSVCVCLLSCLSL